MVPTVEKANNLYSETSLNFSVSSSNLRFSHVTDSAKILVELKDSFLPHCKTETI